MAGSIPPFVSSSPPPLCAFDDDEEEDEDEFGMFNAPEEIDYNECISFKDKVGERQSENKIRGEQDSTSQDSATDSGLCPDSEGVSPTPHSDDERSAKQNTCDRLCQRHPAPDLSVSKCVREHVDLSTAPFDSTAHATLPNGHLDAQGHTTPTESDDDFGNFENFVSTPSPNQHLTEDNVSNNVGLVLRLSETENVIEEVGEEDNKDEVCNKNSAQTVESGKSDQISTVSGLQSDEEPGDDFQCEFPALEHQNSGDDQETAEESIKNKVKFVLESEEHQKKNEDEIENEEDEFNNFVDFKANFPSSLEFSESEQSANLNINSQPLQDPECSENCAKTLQEDEGDDEFSNFADFSSSDCVFVSETNVSNIPCKPSDDSDHRTDSDFQDWVSAFPTDPSDTCSGEGVGTVLLKEDDRIWSRLFPLESSPALSYHWAESLANRHLLSALNIDSRNILFMPWSNSAVPRFAANLSCGPLQPVKAPELITHHAPTRLPTSTQDSVPDAHFDWVGSGLTNPLDFSIDVCLLCLWWWAACHSSLLDLTFMATLGTPLTINPKQVLRLPKTRSAEAEKLLASLPDLSFMRKTYIDFPINKG